MFFSLSSTFIGIVLISWFAKSPLRACSFKMIGLKLNHIFKFIFVIFNAFIIGGYQKKFDIKKRY